MGPETTKTIDQLGLHCYNYGDKENNCNKCVMIMIISRNNYDYNDAEDYGPDKTDDDDDDDD